MGTRASSVLTRRTLLSGTARAGAGALLAGGMAGSLVRRAAAADVTLEFPYLWTGPEGEALQKIVDAFNQSQDKIEVKGVANPDTQRQLAAMASNRGFDISDNFGNNVGSWASRGILEPLDDHIMQAEFDTADFVPAALEQQTYEGKLYALPIAVHTYLLLYNEDLFAEAGIAEPPKTASQWAEAVAKLTKLDGDGNLTQLGLNLSNDNLVTLAFPFGGQWTDEAGNPTPAHPGNIAAIKFWVDNVMAEYGADKVKRFQSGFGEYASPQNPFYTGKVAMVVEGEWQARFIQQYAPDLKWGAVPLPVADDQPELAGANNLETSMFFIPANSQHKQEAWEFLAHLVSPEPMRDFTIALANLPARTSLLEDPTYAEIPGFSFWLESLKSPNLRTFTNAAWGPEYRTEIASALDEIANLNKSPEEGMAEVEEKAKGLAE